MLRFLREGDWDVALGLLPAPDLSREEPVIYDEDSGRVSRIEFKPEHPSADGTWAGRRAWSTGETPWKVWAD